MCQLNSKPMKSAVGFLDVLIPPTFVDNQQTASTNYQQQQQQTSNQNETTTTNTITVVEGANATLTCRATGHPMPTITWRREDSEPILIHKQNGNTEQLTKYEDSSLILSSLSRVNSGVYLCIASNGVQPAASKRVVLDVQFSPILKLPQNEISTQLGQDVQLNCFIDANPVGSFAWQKISNLGDNQARASGLFASSNFDDTNDEQTIELVNSDKHEIVIKEQRDASQRQTSTQLTLTIRKISRHDFGTYRCVARNSLGAQSNTVRVYEHISLLGAMFGSSSNQNHNIDSTTPDSLFSPGIGRQHSLNKQQLQNNNDKSQRTHTRSSWNQRPASGGGGSLLTGSSSSQGAGLKLEQSSAANASAAAIDVSIVSKVFICCICLFLSSLFAKTSPKLYASFTAR